MKFAGCETVSSRLPSMRNSLVRMAVAAVVEVAAAFKSVLSAVVVVVAPVTTFVPPETRVKFGNGHKLDAMVLVAVTITGAALVLLDKV